MPLLGLDIGTIDFRGALSERLREDIGDAFYADTPIGASYNTFPYGWGAPLAFETWLADGGPRGLDALWASPPNTTQQVISLRPELPSQLATNHGPEPQTRYGAPWLRFGFGHCWG